jgi:flagellar hook protein FlgE
VDNADRTGMDVSTIALQGLHQAYARLVSAGSKIASFGASSPSGAGQDTVDLSAAVVALLSAKNLYSASLASVKTADDIRKTSIDLIA